MTVGPMFPKPQKRIKARKPLKRGKRMRRGPPRRLSRDGSDPAYLEAVRQLPCFVREDCDGPVHAHHAIHRSQGGIDWDAVPLCMKHHAEWHNASGFFRELGKEERGRFADAMVAITRLTLKERL